MNKTTSSYISQFDYDKPIFYFMMFNSYLHGMDIGADSAYVGLAAPGDVGSWQSETKVICLFICTCGKIMPQIFRKMNIFYIAWKIYNCLIDISCAIKSILVVGLSILDSFRQVRKLCDKKCSSWSVQSLCVGAWCYRRLQIWPRNQYQAWYDLFRKLEGLKG